MSRIASLFLAGTILASGTLMAQARLTGADLSGTVTDESGAVLPGATVTVTQVETNLTRTTVTDPRGRYLAAALPPGSYRIAIEMSGFAASRREGVKLVLGQS